MTLPSAPVGGPAGPPSNGPRIVDPDAGRLPLVAGALLMIASMLPWLSYPGFGGRDSVSGLDTDGQETIVCGLIVGVLGIVARAGRGRLWVPIVGIVFAALAVFSVGYRVVVVIQQRSEGSEVSPAVGLFASTLLSVLCLYATIRSIRRMSPAEDFGR